MKKFLTWILLLTVTLGSFSGCGMQKPTFDANRPESFDPNRIVVSESDEKKKDYMNQLIADAQKEGTLVVYGSCEEEYLTKACRKFEQLYDIDVQYERLSSGEVQSKIEKEQGNPSADVWFGGTTDPYNLLATEGLLMSYEAHNASHL